MGLMQRIRERIEESGYSVKDMRKIFQMFDADGGGCIDVEEFRNIIQKLQLGISDDRIVDLFTELDVDGDGSIDDRELLRSLFPKEFAEAHEGQPLAARKDGPLDAT